MRLRDLALLVLAACGGSSEPCPAQEPEPTSCAPRAGSYAVLATQIAGSCAPALEELVPNIDDDPLGCTGDVDVAQCKQVWALQCGQTRRRAVMRWNAEGTEARGTELRVEPSCEGWYDLRVVRR